MSGIYLLIAFAVGTIVGILIGSFRTKRKAEAIMKARGWLDGISDEFNVFWNEATSHFRK